MTFAQPLGGLGRLLMVIPWLIGEKEAPIEEMQRRFAIAPEQLVRDIEALNEVDFFVSPEQRFSLEITSERVKVLEAPNFPTTPGLQPFEALACLVAAKTALEITPAAPHLRLAAEKLEQAIMPDAAKALGIVTGASPPWVNQLREWTRDRRVIKMRYRSTDKGELSDREVEPWQVYRWMGVWYLWGHSRTKGEARRYRVDGIQRARATGQVFRPPRRIPAPPTAYRPTPDDHRVVFLIRPEGRWVTEHYAMRVLSEEPEGMLRAEFYTRDPRVAARLALCMGPNLQILEGEEARQALREMAGSALKRYEGSPGTEHFAPLSG